jgi:hypothetical protein
MPWGGKVPIPTKPLPKSPELKRILKAYQQVLVSRAEIAKSLEGNWRNTTSKETANNKSSSSERRPPNSAWRSPQLMCEPTNQEVSGESLIRWDEKAPSLKCKFGREKGAK